MSLDDAVGKLHSNSFILPEDGRTMGKYLVKMTDKGRFLEVGTGSGDSTRFFSTLLPTWTIYTIDSYGMFNTQYRTDSQEKNHFFTTEFEKVQDMISNAIFIIGNSKNIPWELPIEALFVDGDHREEAVEADINKYLPFLVTGGIAFFHDYWNKDFGVEKALSKVKDFVVKEDHGIGVVYRKESLWDEL